MTIDRLVAAVAAAATASTLLLGGWLMISDQAAMLDQAKRREIDKTAVVLTSAMDQAATLSATHAESLAVDPAIRLALKARNRDQLQAYAKPILGRLNRSAGIDVVHFHAADMKSFLRVWDPGNFGQDLSTFRPMVVAANHDRMTRKGLELGIRGLSLRAVSAIAEGEELVGTIEVGVSLQSLADLAKASTGGDYALALDPSFLKDMPNGNRSAPGALVLDANTNKTLFDRVLASGNVVLARSRTTFEFSAEGQEITIQSRPLIDYSGNMIGVLLTTTDFADLRTHYNRSLVTIVIVGIGGFLIIFAAIMAIVRLAVIRPMRALEYMIRAEAENLVAAQPRSGLEDYGNVHQAVVDALKGRRPAEPEGE
ncbi:cache domain-containing protein [Rhizobium terrae]|uniref:cache domain-containing protein n=1 Tax=Rhizobium terrae TaxID=2171756 RepID=UPI0013C35FA8|nr:cache domain-containing protein [Rhizobium terrae]